MAGAGIGMTPWLTILTILLFKAARVPRENPTADRGQIAPSLNIFVYLQAYLL